MNCRCFSRLELTRTGPHQGPVLAWIVQSLRQELDVTIHELDGSTLRLIFPAYYEDYSLNRPAYYFQTRVVGGGDAYRTVFRDRALSAADYDALWPGYIAREHDEDSALRLAYVRLCCPAALGEQAALRYADYLRANLGRALSHALREKDMPGLRMLLKLSSPGTEILDAALQESRTLHLTEATAILLQKRREHPAAGRNRNFDL